MARKKRPKGSHHPKDAPESQSAKAGDEPRASTETEKAWARVIAAVWENEALRKRLKENPRDVLKEYGIEPPEHLNITVHESQPNELHITIPPVPKDIELLGEEHFSVRSRGLQKSFCTYE